MAEASEKELAGEKKDVKKSEVGEKLQGDGGGKEAMKTS